MGAAPLDIDVAPASPTAPRSVYVSTGRIEMVRFLPLAALAIVGAVVMAFLLDLAFVHDAYYIVLMPILAAVCVMPLVMWAIGLGHCRNRLVAVLLALTVCIVLYIGSYAFGLMREIGWNNASRLDLLPSYIRFRMETDTSEEHPGLPKESRPEPFMNWFKLGLEQVCVMLLIVPAAYRRADRAYCERCRRWKTRALAFFPRGSGKAIGELVAAGRFEELGAMTPIAVGPRDRRYTGLAVEYCPPDETGSDCNAVLCVREVKYGGGVSSGPQFDWSFGKTAAPRYELSAEEVAPLRRNLPQLAALVPGPVLPAETTAAIQSSPVMSLRAQAQVLAVPERFAGQVLRRSTILYGNFLALMPLVILLGGAAAALVSLAQLDRHSNEPMWIALAVFCGLVAAGSAYIGLRNPSVIPNRMLRRKARAAIGQRVERWFKMDDPEAIFVEVVPRAHWGKMMLETATDIGFLKIDRAKKAVFFEGDRERWNIPAMAITRISAEPATAGAGTPGEIRYYMTVIAAPVGDELREFSFCKRVTEMFLQRDHREQSAKHIESEIASLLSS